VVLAYVERVKARHGGDGLAAQPPLSPKAELIFPLLREWRGRLNTHASKLLMDFLRSLGIAVAKEDGERGH
jgi:hypothetical protein